jgi:hypothetical protein
MISADDRKDATAIAADFGIEAGEAFCREYVSMIDEFGQRIVEAIRAEGQVRTRQRGDAPLRDVLTELAKGPAEAAELLLADSRGELPSWQADALSTFLEKARCLPVYGGLWEIDLGVSVAITRGFQRLSDKARETLADIGPAKRGPRADEALGRFVEDMVGTAIMRAALGPRTLEELATDPKLINEFLSVVQAKPEHLSLTAGVSRALGLAVCKLRGKLGGPDIRDAIDRQLEDYLQKTDAALRHDVSAAAADTIQLFRLWWRAGETDTQVIRARAGK